MGHSTARLCHIARRWWSSIPAVWAVCATLVPGPTTAAGTAARDVDLAPAFQVRSQNLDASRRTLEAVSTGEFSAVWVYLTDKAIFDSESCRARLSEVRNVLDERAIRRRRRSLGPELVDFFDVPVHAPYRAALERMGAVVRRESRWLNAVSIEASRDVLEQVITLEFVQRIEPVRAYRTTPGGGTFGSGSAGRSAVPRSVQRGTIDYGPSFDQLDEIGVIDAHSAGFTGAGVLITLLDTGFKRDHPAFQHILDDGRLVAQWDLVNDDGETMDGPEDVPGGQDHGSSVWSVCAGFTEGELIGPAYGASYALAKTEDVTSETPLEEDNWIAAAEWADALGTDIISSSLTYTDWYTVDDMDGDTAVISVGADVAASRGILVSVAAGNMGDQDWYIVTPAADADSVIAVGAVDADNQLTGFSSHGPTADGRTKPEVVARGLAVVCACNFTHDPLGDEFATNNGTSLAAPLVSGAAALVIEAHPGWSAMEVRTALMATADNAETPDNDRGWGRIDAWSAITGTVAVPEIVPAVPVLLATPNPSGATIRLIVPYTSQAGHVEVHDVQGRLVWSAPMPAGGTEVTWDGRDRSGRVVGQGVYVASLRAGDWRATAKLVRGGP